jgi:hypothetical protein
MGSRWGRVPEVKIASVEAGAMFVTSPMTHRAVAWIGGVLVLTVVVPAFGQQQIVPPPPVLVTSPIVTVNNSPGRHAVPRVDRDLTTYTDLSVLTSTVRYYRFSTAADFAIPDSSGLADVSADRIAFGRSLSDRFGIFVFDTLTGLQTEIDPVAGSVRREPAIGGDTVAFVDIDPVAASYRILAHDLSTGRTVELDSIISPGLSTLESPAVAPSGNIVVWHRCNYDLRMLLCDVMKSVYSSGTWGSPTVVASGSYSVEAHTDGTWIAYRDWEGIKFQPVAGGPATQLALAGFQYAPFISRGVISFLNRSDFGHTDLFVYVISNNTLYQVTSTPASDEGSNSVSVLDNRDIRVVWNGDGPDLATGDIAIYATTFTPNGAPDQLRDLASLVQSYNMQQGTTTSLDSKLQASLAAAQVGDVATACAKLQDFINVVNAQTRPPAHKSLTTAQASQLIAAANQIKAALGCP